MKSLFNVITLSFFITISAYAGDKKRMPSSSDNEHTFQMVYRGYPLVISKDESLLDKGEVLKHEKASELCKKAGAKDGHFLSSKLVDYGDRGADWAAVYDQKEDKVKLEERNKFVSADFLVCQYTKRNTCYEQFNRLSIFDIFFPNCDSSKK